MEKSTGNEIVEVFFIRTGKTRTYNTMSEGINDLASLGFRMITYQFGEWENNQFIQVAVFERLVND